MSKSLIRLSCQVYLLVVLLSAVAVSAFPYSAVALVLLAVMLFVTFRPLQPRLNIVITVATVFLLSVVLESLLQYLLYAVLPSPAAQRLIAVIAVLPVIYLLDCYLRQNAGTMTIAHGERDRSITAVSRALFAASLCMVLVSLITGSMVLLFTAVALILYLLVALVRALYIVGRFPLDIPLVKKRVIAGATASVSLCVTNRTAAGLYVLLSPVDSWVAITPRRLAVDTDGVQLDVVLTPPLAGPSRPQIRMSVIDPWGIVQVDRVIKPVELHVIPRAKYAEWLAMRYLEQTGTGATMATAPLTEVVPKQVSGVEYFDSRDYQPGDSLKHVDWKHTLKLNQIIVNEYAEAGGQASIIALNLLVTDAEEADKLAFNLITTGLTLASESIPAALAVYNRREVVLTTPVIDPREMLKKLLVLVKDLTSVEFAHRFLQPPDIGRLRRNVALLERAVSQPARQLLDMLRFEYSAVEEAARAHPATLALLRVSGRVPPPAVVVLVSPLNHDAEALLVATEKLSNRGFTILRIGATELIPQR
jgi:uncharacterized protein (DUF58 family)